LQLAVYNAAYSIDIWRSRTAGNMNTCCVLSISSQVPWFMKLGWTNQNRHRARGRRETAPVSRA
jgi:hypothetical protein